MALKMWLLRATDPGRERALSLGPMHPEISGCLAERVTTQRGVSAT